ncbi:MAG TPA: transaldolase [Thermomicrobiales bacterium]|nr:transaldolase [Thermomicrobiales bacterium]
MSRGLLTSGELRRLIQLDGVTGVTTNPTIFAKALIGSSEYDDSFTDIVHRHPDISNATLAERLMIEDIQMAADQLRPVFDRTNGADGFVSLEVSPACSGDTEATVAEARRLWFDVARLNVMIKVPATKAGISAVETLIAQGINVNITLMFSLDHYEAVAKAYLHGLSGHEGRHHVSSVASIFVSRLDAAVDPLLDAIGSPESKRLRGRVALANARHIYRRFRAIFHGEPFVDLRRRNARVQRPLWASTGTKDPTYSDVLYLEGLVASETVTTVPPATLDAFRDHGTVEPGILESTAPEDDATLAGAARLGINLFAITEQLQSAGIGAFARSYEQLLDALDRKRRAAEGTG